MAKTRRKKINTRPKTVYGTRNVTPAFLENGLRVKVAGFRAEEGKKQIASKDAKPVFIGRVYTGHNHGKTYPYAGKNRGGVGGSR